MAGFKNLDSLISKLTALGGNGDQAIKRGIEKGVKNVLRDAKKLCPEDTGTLRSRIQGETKVQDGVVIGKVSTNVKYAQYVEFGTGQRGQGSPSPPKYPGDIRYRQDWVGMPAQPFLYPAIKYNEDKIIDDVASELRKEIRKMAK